MRPTKAFVDLDALRHNLQIAARLAPASKNVAVIKANAYGHGMVEAGLALQSVADALAVATIDEALILRDAGINSPLLVLQGVSTRGDVEEAMARGLWLMLHDRGQVDKALSAAADGSLTAWLKVDSGMHRLGMPLEEAEEACCALLASPKVCQPPVLATHMACADELDSPYTPLQLERFLSFASNRGLPLSIANSASIMHWPETHSEWNRPGYMLYVASPLSTFDGDGVLRNWWTDEDKAEFEKRTAKLIGQYSEFKPFDDLSVNGEFTLGENIGDLGGLSIALLAYELSLDGKEAPVMDGFTGEQRVFLGYAQGWMGKSRDESLRQQIKTDPHSPRQYRVNGVVRNVPEFYEVFDIAETDALYLAPEDRVKIW